MTKRGPPSWTIRARRMGEMRRLAQRTLPLGRSAALVPYTLPILRFAILPAFSFVHAIRITILAGTVAASVTGPRVCRRHGGDRNHHKHCPSQPGAKHRSFSLTRYRHHNGRGGAGKSRAQAGGALMARKMCVALPCSSATPVAGCAMTPGGVRSRVRLRPKNPRRIVGRTKSIIGRLSGPGRQSISLRGCGRRAAVRGAEVWRPSTRKASND